MMRIICPACGISHEEKSLSRSQFIRDYVIARVSSVGSANIDPERMAITAARIYDKYIK